MLDRREIDIHIAQLEYMESSYPNYAKLADLYVIRDQMDKSQNPEVLETAYSSAPAPKETLENYGDSEFLQAIYGKDQAEVWAIIDDLMDTLHAVNPRVYNGVMKKISNLDG